MEHAHDPKEFDSLIDAAVDLTRPQPIETPWGVLALFRVDGAVICVQAFCPHLEGPLFQGSVAAGEVVCPWHLWAFDVRTGNCPGGNTMGVAKHEVRIEGDRVLVKLEQSKWKLLQ